MNDQKILIHANEKIPRFDFEKLEPLQGALKSLSEDSFTLLKKSILKHGFFVPVFLWHKGEQIHILDGHQRIRVLSVLKKEGYAIPKIPGVLIEAKNKKEAKEKLLAITSSFGKIEIDGLYEFWNGFDHLMLNDFKLPEIDIPKFLKGFYETDDDLLPEKEATGSQEISSSRFETFHCKCPKCGFEFDTERNGKKDAD